MATSAPTAPAAPRQLHFALLFMRPNADNLRLVGCTANAGRGDYLCGFTHGFPAATHLAGTGHAHFTAAPADKVGWYMTVLNDCS